MKKLAIMFGGLSLLASAVAVPALADTTTSTVPVRPKVDTVCMQNATAARETAIANGFSAYSSAVSAALSARASALNSAWSKTTAKERNAALKAVWKTYRSSVSSARSTWSKARQAAWTAFYGTRKTCGPGSASEDATTHGVDASL